ncbi:hypothetical protein pb186bvf_006911 [Paramecium bursaria]
MSKGPIQLKLLVVGDGTVGKTCCLITYSTGKFPEQYIPTIFDTYSLKMVVDAQEVNVGLWDTAGQEEFAKIRPMSYPNTNICLIIFSIDSPESFDNAIKKWYPEIRENIPKAIIVLVGSKSDLRDNKKKCITKEQAQKTADNLKVPYYECSSFQQIGLKELFEGSVRIALANNQNLQSARKQDQNSSQKDKSYEFCFFLAFVQFNLNICFFLIIIK